MNRYRGATQTQAEFDLALSQVEPLPSDIVQAHALPTAPCPSCSAPIVRAVDGMQREVALEPGAAVGVIVGMAKDGRAMIFAPSNALPIHICGGTR